MINVTRQSTTTLRKVEPAQFISFRYRDSDGEHSERNVLALAHDDEKELLHALDLDKFSDQNLVNTGRELARISQDLEEFEETFAEDAEVTLDNVQDSEVERWYETEYSSSIYEENPYRTFRKDGIRNLREAEITIE